MDLKPTSEQEQLVAAFSGLFRASFDSGAVRSAESTGLDEKLWAQLLEMGSVVMGVPEEYDGWGASLLDLALVAEQAGSWLAPAPIIETQVAARLLARLAGSENAAEAELARATLDAVITGESSVTLALHPVVRNQARLVPAGNVADKAIVLLDDRLLLAHLGEAATAVANTGGLALADVVVDAASPALGSGALALEFYAQALDEWRALAAAALVGVATRALQIGVDYVKERKAFGRAIGGFQAVAHRLADCATEVDGALLLAREAAWSAESAPGRAAELAAMSLGFAAETAQRTTHASLHFHGGYGFMLEYDIQLYFRRARSWGAILEEPAESYARAARAGVLVEALSGVA